MKNTTKKHIGVRIYPEQKNEIKKLCKEHNLTQQQLIDMGIDLVINMLNTIKNNNNNKKSKKEVC